MTQQNPIINSSDMKYTRLLFVKNSVGAWDVVNANLIEPYTPPYPTYNNVDVQVINAPSRLHGLGVDCYTVSLNLLFPDRASLAAWLNRGGLEHKYYDEKGTIFIGLIQTIQTITRYKGSSQYSAQVTFMMNKKNDEDATYQTILYSDISGNAYAADAQEMTYIGAGMGRDDYGNQLSVFLPASMMTKGQWYTYLYRTVKFLKHRIGQ